MAKEIRAIARVQVTVEVEVGVWDDSTPLSQVHEQARASVIQKVRQAMSGNGPTEQRQFQIVGEPKITAILTQS